MPRDQSKCVKQLSGPAKCNTSTHSSRPSNAKGPIKVVLSNCLVQQNVIQVHMIPTLDLGSDHVISIIYNSIRFISLNCLNNCMTVK